MHDLGDQTILVLKTYLALTSSKSLKLDLTLSKSSKLELELLQWGGWNLHHESWKDGRRGTCPATADSRAGALHSVVTMIIVLVVVAAWYSTCTHACSTPFMRNSLLLPERMACVSVFHLPAMFFSFFSLSLWWSPADPLRPSTNFTFSGETLQIPLESLFH